MADDPNRQPAARKPDADVADTGRRTGEPGGKKKLPAQKPENTFEGDGSPGLTISGGGGNA
jgi:hypothetical protein